MIVLSIELRFSINPLFNFRSDTTTFNGTTVASGSFTISHNSDGSKSFSASAEEGIYTFAVNCSGSGSWSLPTIARATGTELVDLILKYYEVLSERYRKMIPLKMVYIPVPKEED